MLVKNVVRFAVSRVPFLNQWMIRQKINKVSAHMISEKDAVLGDTDDRCKKRSISERHEKDSTYIDEFISSAQFVLEKSLPQEAFVDETYTAELIQDMLWCNLAYGFQADEYIMFRLEKKTPEERKMFISDVDRYAIYYRNNNFYDRMVFIDKYDTYKQFKTHYKRKMVRIRNEADFETYTNFVKEFPEFVVKQPDLSQGDSVRLCRSAGGNEKELKQELKMLLHNGTVVLEERIEQAKELKKLHPASVNTVRCMTIHTGKEIVVFYPFVKIGQSGSFVDNGGKGGILAGVDTEKGTICTDGLDETGRIYTKHPDTGIVLNGYQLPEWEKCLELVKTCALQCPTVRMVGWDTAYSVKGWMIVEGNAQGQFVGQQGTIGRGLKEELKEILRDAGLLDKGEWL